jgi:hypothetical protein
MADKDITNQQLLEALTVKFDGRFNTLEGRFDGLEGRFDGLETRFDKLENMVASIGDTLAGVVNTMATSEELDRFREESSANLDNLELRLGRRIDYMRPLAKKRKFIAAKL